MTKLEKVIRALVLCTDKVVRCEECEYQYDCHVNGAEHAVMPDALELLQALKPADWRFVARDGNPDKEGVYDVILIYHGWDKAKQEANDELFATRDLRWFGDADKCRGWAMEDQPDHGLVWSEETGSSPRERVYAWLPQRDYPNIALPEGVKWE